jgi:MYXO-CTERM domain-containing protein
MVGRAGNQALGAALAAVLGLSGCMARVDEDPGDDVGASAEALSSPKLRASKYVKLWSNLRKAVSGAHYVACPKQAFKLTLRFRNKGNVVWRDVSGRGKSVGSDVFLRTASNKPDVLTGEVHYSVNDDANDYVRWDRGAGECAVSPGCRQTRFILHGLEAIAPETPGKVYKSRWQMRDYSKHWSHPQAFGPKITVRVAVVQCPTQCGCTATCTDGKSTPMEAAFIHDAASCQDVAQTFCSSSTTQFLRSSYVDCDGGTTPEPPTVGNPGDEDLDDPVPDNSWWVQPDEDAGGGGGGSGGTWPGVAGAGGSGASADPWFADPDPGIGEQPDPPGSLPDNFDGVSEKGGVIPADDAGCTVAAVPTSRWSLAALAALVALVVGRRRRSLRTRRARPC